MLCRFLWSFVWATTLVAQSTTSLLSPVADQRALMPPGIGAATLCVTADMNADGLVDIVRVAGDELIVLLQDSTGRFAPHGPNSSIAFPQAAGGIQAVAVGQLDNDQKLDLVVGLGAASDQVLRGDGAGGFALRKPTPIPTTSFVSTRSILVGDFDRKNGDDLLVLAQFTSPILLLSDGSGGFRPAPARLPTGFFVGYSTGNVVDIDADGDLDIVLASDQRALPIVLHNNGQADFRTNVVKIASTTLGVRQIEVADIDGDLLKDLILVGKPSGVMQPPEVLRNIGGSFVPYSVTANLGTVSIEVLKLADLNRDKLQDLIVIGSDGTVVTAFNAGSGVFKNARKSLGEGSRGGIAVVDLEGDGDLDVYLPGHDSEDVVLLGDGRGDLFDPREIGQRFPDSLAGQMTAIVDLNNDGDSDFLFYNRAGEPSTWLSVAGSRFEQRRGFAPKLPLGGGYFDLEPATFGRGTSDLVVIGPSSAANPQGIRCLELTPTGYLDVTARLWPQPSNTLFLKVASGHFTHKAGASDLVVADGAQGVRLFRMAAGGAYQEVLGVFGNRIGTVREFVHGDIDGDGLDDLLLIPGQGLPEVFLGRPNGFLSIGTVAASITQAVSGQIVDVTGDGQADLLLATPRQVSGIRILAGNGLGKFRDVTTTLASGLRASGAESVSFLQSRGQAFIAIGRPGARDLIIRRGPMGFTRVSSTWMHGSQATGGMLRTDLDGDGDDDLVVLRSNSGPALLWNRGIQLTQLGTGQAGRKVLFSLEAPPKNTAFLFASAAMIRVDIPGFGLLRLLSPFSVLSMPIPASGRGTIVLSIPRGIAAGVVPLQFASLDPKTFELALSNLEPLVITGH